MKALISPIQFGVLITAAYIGAGIFEFPRHLVNTAGPDAFYAYLLVCTGALFGLWLWLRVNRIDPGRPVSAFAGELITPPLGYLSLAFTVAVHTALAVIVLSNFTFVMHTFFLTDTPPAAVRIAIALVSLYSAWFGLASLTRTLQLVYIPAVALSVLMAVLLISKMDSLYAVVPSANLHLNVIVLAAYRGSYLFWGYELTVTLYPFVRPEARTKAASYAMWAMAGTCVFFTLGYLLTLGTSGPELLAREVWPGVSTMRLVDVSSFLIDRLGLLLISWWSLFAMSFLTLRLWCLANDVLGVWPNATLRTYRALLVVFVLVVLAIANRIPTVTALDAFMQAWMVPTMLVFNFTMPPVFLLAAAVRRRLAPRATPAPA